jgi:hypothetical protein
LYFLRGDIRCWRLNYHSLCVLWPLRWGYYCDRLGWSLLLSLLVLLVVLFVLVMIYWALCLVVVWFVLLPLALVVLYSVFRHLGCPCVSFILCLLVSLIWLVRWRFVWLGALNVFWARLKKLGQFCKDLPRLLFHFDIFPAGGVESPCEVHHIASIHYLNWLSASLVVY